VKERLYRAKIGYERSSRGKEVKISTANLARGAEGGEIAGIERERREGKKGEKGLHRLRERGVPHYFVVGRMRTEKLGKWGRAQEKRLWGESPDRGEEGE